MWDKNALTMAHYIFYNCIMEKLYLDLSKWSLLKKFKGDFFMVFYPKETKLTQKIYKTYTKKRFKGNI